MLYSLTFKYISMFTFIFDRARSKLGLYYSQRIQVYVGTKVYECETPYVERDTCVSHTPIQHLI